MDTALQNKYNVTETTLKASPKYKFLIRVDGKPEEPISCGCLNSSSFKMFKFELSQKLGLEGTNIILFRYLVDGKLGLVDDIDVLQPPPSGVVSSNSSWHERIYVTTSGIEFFILFKDKHFEHFSWSTSLKKLKQEIQKLVGHQTITIQYFDSDILEYRELKTLRNMPQKIKLNVTTLEPEAPDPREIEIQNLKEKLQTTDQELEKVKIENQKLQQEISQLRDETPLPDSPDKLETMEWIRKGGHFTEPSTTATAPPLKPQKATTKSTGTGGAVAGPTPIIPMNPTQNAPEWNLPKCVDYLAEVEKKKPHPMHWAHFRRMRGLPVLPIPGIPELNDQVDFLNSLSPQQALLNFFEFMNSSYPDWSIYSTEISKLPALMVEKATQLRTIGTLLIEASNKQIEIPTRQPETEKKLAESIALNQKYQIENAKLTETVKKSKKNNHLLIAYQNQDSRLQGTLVESTFYDFSTVKEPIAWISAPGDKLYSLATIPELEPPVRALFFESVPESVQITRIQFINNFVLKNRFEATIVMMENTTYEPLCQPFKHTPEKEFVYQRIIPRFQPACDNKKVKISQCWGTNNAPEAIHELCHSGLADIRVLSPGFFGTGICVTPQANYAIAYSPKPAPNSDGEYCLLLCWVVTSNIYPVSRDTDYDSSSSPSQFFDEKRGIALKSGFDSHCACVDPKRHYQAAKFVESQNAFDRDSKDLVDEIILKESAQALPYCVVYYKK